MPNKALTTDERFDKVDAQLAEMNKELDKIVAVVVGGFDHIVKAIAEKAAMLIYTVCLVY